MSVHASSEPLTQQRVLDKVYRVFCSVAIDTLSLSQLARLCQVAEETLQQQYGTLAELYQSAFHHALRQQSLLQPKPTDISKAAWLSGLIEDYLSDQHLRGESHRCPLAFLLHQQTASADVVRETYASAYLACTRWLSQYIEQEDASVQASQLLTTLVGAVSIARCLDLESSRYEYISRVKNDLYRRLSLPPLLI